jgi:AmmeMemoRadiSam system protein A
LPRELAIEHRRQLLATARSAITSRLTGEAFRIPDAPPPLREPRGAFVSLHAKASHALRGCIGYVEPTLPLIDVVARVAESAAFEDPRFPPLVARELPGIHIEISVLSVPEEIRLEDIEVGVHGLIVERGPRRGLLLPQVALEYGWGREDLLDHTCRKAGLPAAAWREPGTRVLAFSAEVFGEATAPEHGV